MTNEYVHYSLSFFIFLYLYHLGWHTLPSHANAESCLNVHYSYLQQTLRKQTIIYNIE